jgi:hypothetical protein
MPGNLNDALPEVVNAANEQLLDDLLKRKLTTACSIAVELLRGMEAHFGPEVREVLRKMAENRKFPSRSNFGSAEDDLRSFCDDLDKACIGTHRWEREMEERDRIGYQYTRCMWAEIFQELGEPDLGYMLCAGDKPAVEAYNPELGFQRTKVLMHGDEICDHEFFVKGD